jgi:hypothetical protein
VLPSLGFKLNAALPVNTVSGDSVTALVQTSEGYRCIGIALAVCDPTNNGAQEASIDFECISCTEQTHCAAGASGTSCANSPEAYNSLVCSTVTDVGYRLDGDTVKPNVCTCEGGEPAENVECPEHGSPLCRSCDNGYALDGSVCVPNVCTTDLAAPTGSTLAATPSAPLQSGDDVSAFLVPQENFICNGSPTAQCIVAGGASEVAGYMCASTVQPAGEPLGDDGPSVAYRLDCSETLAGAQCHHGRVEVLGGGSWGTLCELGLDFARAADVICSSLGFATGELYTYGLSTTLPDVPISTQALPFRDSSMDAFCKLEMDMGAVCYNDGQESLPQLWVRQNNCSATSGDALPGQSIVFGCTSLTTVRCEANGTVGPAYEPGRSQYATCREADATPGYCHASLSSTARLRNEDVCLFVFY